MSKVPAVTSIEKPKFPKVAPTIEIFPGVRAKLMHDFSKYSSGSMAMTLAQCEISSGDKRIGTMSCGVDGRWFVHVGSGEHSAMYEVPMSDLFEAFYAAHENTRKAQNEFPEA